MDMLKQPEKNATKLELTTSISPNRQNDNAVMPSISEKAILFSGEMHPKFHFEDALVFWKVEEEEINDLNYAKSLRTVYKRFLKRVYYQIIVFRLAQKSSK